MRPRHSLARRTHHRLPSPTRSRRSIRDRRRRGASSSPYTRPHLLFALLLLVPALRHELPPGSARLTRSFACGSGPILEVGLPAPWIRCSPLPSRIRGAARSSATPSGLRPSRSRGPDDPKVQFLCALAPNVPERGLAAPPRQLALGTELAEGPDRPALRGQTVPDVPIRARLLALGPGWSGLLPGPTHHSTQVF